MAHAFSLGIGLFGLWMLLSGHTSALLVALGLGSCILVVVLALRMDVVDHEGHPLHLRWSRVPGYLLWLGREIVVSNIDVARRVISPSMPISPTVVRLPCSQRSDLGRVIYANSITLTPGTVSMDVLDDEVVVHALTREGARALADGEMDARVTALEGDV